MLTSPTIADPTSADPTGAESEFVTRTWFDQTTEIVARADTEHGFHAELDPTWASLRGVHGGYLSALAVRAAQAAAPGRAVRTVATSFLRPAETGSVDIDVEVLRAGRSFTTLVSSLHQRGRPIITTRVTALAAVLGHDWASPPTARPGAISAAIPFTPPPSIPHFQQAEFLIDPATIPEGNAEHALIAGYVRPIEPRPIDASWLVMIGDWFPPSPFRRLLPPAGGISIDYTVHIHRPLQLAADEWLAGVFETRTSNDGIALEHGTLATMDGRPVAETFHTRWTG